MSPAEFDAALRRMQMRAWAEGCKAGIEHGSALLAHAFDGAPAPTILINPYTESFDVAHDRPQ